jgi:hypothetical protein
MLKNVFFKINKYVLKILNEKLILKEKLNIHDLFNYF